VLDLDEGEKTAFLVFVVDDAGNKTGYLFSVLMIGQR
jgi:hypothetical protein